MQLDFLAPEEKLDRIYRARLDRPTVAITTAAVGVVVGMFLLAGIKACDKIPQPVAAAQNCVTCHHVTRHQKMAEYFRKSGHPTDPDRMATAVLSTSHPKLLAAIAVSGEKNSPATSTHGGYKGRHVGSWQMSRLNEKAYGKTPADPVGQALQAERLLKDLLAEHPMPVALAKWGGDSTTKYQRRVLAELTRTP